VKPMFKRRPVRLYGAALKRVCAEVYERDHGQCVNCGHAVPEGTKPHHVVFKSRGGGDTADNMVMLCVVCHWQVHHGKHGHYVQDKCKRMLRWLYHEV